MTITIHSYVVFDRDGNCLLKRGFPRKSILASSNFVFGISGTAILIFKTPKNAIKLIDYYIASGPPSTICTCQPVNYTCNLGKTATQKSSSSSGHLLVSFSVYSFLELFSISS